MSRNQNKDRFRDRTPSGDSGASLEDLLNSLPQRPSELIQRPLAPQSLTSNPGFGGGTTSPESKTFQAAVEPLTHRASYGAPRPGHFQPEDYPYKAKRMIRLAVLEARFAASGGSLDDFQKGLLELDKGRAQDKTLRPEVSAARAEDLRVAMEKAEAAFAAHGGKGNYWHHLARLQQRVDFKRNWRGRTTSPTLSGFVIPRVPGTDQLSDKALAMGWGSDGGAGTELSYGK